MIPLPGGFQPRAAVGYGLVSALEAAALGGAGPSLRDEVEAAAALAETLAAEWGPDGAEDDEAKRLARALHGTVPVIAGAELTAPVAYRWKCQINENAGLPAFASVLPELDHNEVVGWPGADGLGPFSAVFLEDAGRAPAQRAALRAQRASRPRPAPASSSASAPAARPRSSGSSRSCCSATSSRSTWPCSPGPTRSTSRRSTASRPRSRSADRAWQAPVASGSRRGQRHGHGEGLLGARAWIA